MSARMEFCKFMLAFNAETLMFKADLLSGCNGCGGCGTGANSSSAVLPRAEFDLFFFFHALLPYS